MGRSGRILRGFHESRLALQCLTEMTIGVWMLHRLQ